MTSPDDYNARYRALDTNTAEGSGLPQVAHESNLEPSNRSPGYQVAHPALGHQVAYGTPGLEHAGHTPKTGYTALAGHGYQGDEPPSEFTGHGRLGKNTSGEGRKNARAFWKRPWIIAGVIGLLVVGALVGGLAGGLLSRKSGGDSTAAIIIATTPSLLGSQISAVNWTDSDGVSRRAVFYQINGSLIMSRTMGDSNAWTQVNISDQFANETGSQAIRAKDSTPLAAAAVPSQGLNTKFIATLYFLDADNQVRELLTSDDDLSTWTHGAAWDYTFTAASTSRLAATAFYCPSGCLNVMCFTYQDDSRNVIAACGNDWASPATIVQASSGTPLSLIPFAADDGRNVSWVTEMRLFYAHGTDIGIYFFNHNDDGDWDLDGTSSVQVLGTGINGTLPLLATTPWDFNANIMAVGMDGNGTFVESRWQKAWFMNQQTSFSNENGTTTIGKPSTSMSSIAMNYDHRLYGVAEDGSKLMEYSWSSNSPTKFNWASNVISG